MDNPDTGALLPVTPEDREIAAQVYDARPGDWSGSSDQVRRGLHDDTVLVQAFARYREMLTAKPIVAQTDRDAARQLLDQLHIRERETGSFRSWDETAQAFARHRIQSETGAALTSDGGREAALVAAVRGALECLGKPDGYLPDIGAPKTRALQRAFEAYEPHPTFKGY